MSTCAAFAVVGDEIPHVLVRGLHLLLFLILYLVFAVLFGIRLNKWNDNTDGLCYNTNGLALPNAAHPYVDKIYLAITCLYFFATLGIVTAQLLSPNFKEWTDSKRDQRALRRVRWQSSVSDRGTTWNLKSFISILDRLDRDESNISAEAQLPAALTVALMQLPLHLYMIICIRLSNEPLLVGGDAEMQWSFGQTYALIAAAGFFVECIKTIFGM